MKRRETRLVLLLLVVLSPMHVAAQGSCADEVASIKAYSKRVDQIIKRKAARKFIRTRFGSPRAEGVEWQELAADTPSRTQFGNDPATVAHVWLAEGKVVAVRFVLQFQSGDMNQQTTYYYRDDGSLGMVESRFNAERTLQGERYYDRKGALLSAWSRVCGPRTGRLEITTDRDDEPSLAYKTTDELPFRKLLTR